MKKTLLPEFSDIAQQLNRIEKYLQSLHSQAKTEKEYLTTREACQFLCVGRSYIHKLVSACRIDRLKMDNGRTYYRTDQLKALIEKGLPQEKDFAEIVIPSK